MALFEGYERRIDKINGVLKEYGISSVEECRDICLAKSACPACMSVCPCSMRDSNMRASSPGTGDGPELTRPSPWESPMRSRASSRRLDVEAAEPMSISFLFRCVEVHTERRFPRKQSRRIRAGGKGMCYA